MTDVISSIIDDVIEREGPTFTNDPADSGGPTKYGVTLDAWREYVGPIAQVSDIENLTPQQAHEFFHWKYVKRPRLDEVVAISISLGARLVDAGVLCGPPIAIQLLQRSLNALNMNASKYPDVDVDALIGTETIAALRSYIEWRGDEGIKILLEAVECLLGARFIEIAERRPKDEKWLYGWLRNRVVIV